jgi:hypothetical protein
MALALHTRRTATGRPRSVLTAAVATCMLLAATSLLLFPVTEARRAPPQTLGQPQPSRVMVDLMQAMMRGKHSKATTKAMRQCLTEAVPAGAPAWTDNEAGRQPGQSDEAFVFATLMGTHPELGDLAACFVKSGLLSRNTYRNGVGGVLLSVAASLVGSNADTLGFFEGACAARCMTAWLSA